MSFNQTDSQPIHTYTSTLPIPPCITRISSLSRHSGCALDRLGRHLRICLIIKGDPLANQFQKAHLSSSRAMFHVKHPASSTRRAPIWILSPLRKKSSSWLRAPLPYSQTGGSLQLENRSIHHPHDSRLVVAGSQRHASQVSMPGRSRVRSKAGTVHQSLQAAGVSPRKYSRSRASSAAAFRMTCRHRGK